MKNPYFECDNPTLNKAYRLALACLAANTLYVGTGRLEKEEPCVMAGLDYETPWTRDAAINVINAVALLDGETAKNTLVSVLGERDGREYVDGQYWDKVIWALGLKKYFDFSADKEFLRRGYAAMKTTLAYLREEEFDESKYLFRGPAVYGDGVSAYPQKYHNENFSSAIWTWQDSHPWGKFPAGYGLPMFALSTNCLYAEVYRVMGETALILGEEAQAFFAESKKMKAAINAYFYDEKRKTYDYLCGESRAQEAIGLAFCILFGIADEKRAEEIAKNAYATRFGIPCVYPTFERYRVYGYGRHSGTVWPHAQGFWALAMRKCGENKKFDHELFALSENAVRDGQFAEIYHPESGEIYGGIQEEIVEGKKVYKLWKSCDYQSWSATACLSMIFEGIFGISAKDGKLEITPRLPCGVRRAQLLGLTCFGKRYDIFVCTGDKDDRHFTHIAEDHIKMEVTVKENETED